MPRGIGIVTSLQAAALRDVLTTLARRAPMIPVTVFPAPVQGDTAPALIARAIEQAGAARAAEASVDVLIVCRGGGSIEDLWSFNTEVVARAIAACAVPVVCGVGHETDFSIADWVADVRAPTPTAAAELASPNIDQMQAQLGAVATALKQAAARCLVNAQQRLDWLARALVPPSARLALQRQRLGHLGGRLQAAGTMALTAHRARLGQARARIRGPALGRHGIELAHARKRLTGAALGGVAAQDALLERLSAGLHMLNPQRVLERGFAIAVDAQGRAVRDATSIAAGDRLALRFARGTAAVRVEQSESE